MSIDAVDDAHSEARPWKRALGWLLFLGPFFFGTYGFANWLAGTREGVGSVVFAWERAIPFVPWTIVPYWSIDLLYAISLFVCTTRREVDRHAQRLLAVQLLSIFFFLLVPLQFTFDRPAAEGLFGDLFAALGSFDKPYNQAPSLHIGLLIVIWVPLARHTARRWRPLLHGWMALIGLSILTTYQHHFIDLPTGLAAGFFVLWLLPDERRSPLRGMRFTRDRTRRKLALRYALGAMAFPVIASLGGIWLWLCWPALALLLVSLHYALVGADGFQKGSDGRLSLGASALLLPYLGAAWLNSRWWTRRHPQPCEIIDGVSIGRMPAAGESHVSIVDLSAELACRARPGFYRGFPSLDLVAPDRATLQSAADAIEEARQHGPVLVCCALGYSRSAAAVVAWLLKTGRAATVEEAIELVRRARPSIVLRREVFA